MKRCAFVLPAAHADPSVVIAHDRLRYGQAQSGAVLLCRVIRGQDSVALFGCESLAGIRQFENRELVIAGSTEGKLAALGHGIDGVEHQVLNDAPEQHGIGADTRNLAELELGFDFTGSLRKLSLKELNYA